MIKIIDLLIKLLNAIKQHLKGREQTNVRDSIKVLPSTEKPLKLGKERLSFYNASETGVKKVIDTYKHFKTDFKGVTIHNNGNPSSTARQDVSWAINSLPKVSWHYSVDDKEVVRFLAHPNYYNYSSWSAGDGIKGFGNSKTINIEICEFNGYNNPKDKRWLKSRENAIHLIAQLCFDEGWTIKNIGRHFDRSGKNCPRVINRDGYAQFLTEVDEILKKMRED